ncbi:hypothetical protein CFP56_005607 [Quercus suber]|uniref:Secreted protein n=1 Tax=Quercus suber TaxID=58331 RepID=A0AAW0L8K8_QUESU
MSITSCSAFEIVVLPFTALVSILDLSSTALALVLASPALRLVSSSEFVIGAIDLETDTFRDSMPIPETIFVRWILWRVQGVELLGNGGVRSGRVVD